MQVDRPETRKKYPETISLMGGPFDGAWVTEGSPEYDAQMIALPLDRNAGGDMVEPACIASSEAFVLHRYVKRFPGEALGVHRVVFVWDGVS